MKNHFYHHAPTEEDIKEVADELGLFRNVHHLLACDINDVKVIMSGAANFILVEGIGNGSERLSNLRNEDMLSIADVLVAFGDGESHGTKHMIEISQEKGIPVWVFNYKDNKSEQK